MRDLRPDASPDRSPVHAYRRHAFAGAKNGALLRAVAPDYDVFLTTDKSIPYQQNLKKFAIAFIILRAASNDVGDLLPLLPRLTAALERIEAGGYAPGDLYEIATK
ncbi:MAG: hypothetical protein M3348_03110 [Acidobacteriota bacterium]|nr:hypothetical protein [Acidobacteriota bacterium]